MFIRSGFWRENPQSEIIIPCNDLPENCIGGISDNNICFEGHIGAKCDECDIQATFWTQNYAKSGKFSCQSCEKIKNNSIIVVLLTLWTLISIVLAIKGDLEVV